MKETNRSKQAFEDYFALGPGRSLSALVESYRKRTKPAPPTRQLTTLKVWSTQFGWQARIAEREAEIAKQAKQALASEKAKVLQSGYALFFKRIETLNRLAELLWEEVNTTDKRWLPDVKQIGAGESAERVDIVRFNAPLIEQLRGALNDLAAEMGERVKGIEVSGKDGGPIQMQDLEAVRARRWTAVAPAMAEALNGENGAKDA